MPVSPRPAPPACLSAFPPFPPGRYRSLVRLLKLTHKGYLLPRTRAQESLGRGSRKIVVVDYRTSKSLFVVNSPVPIQGSGPPYCPALTPGQPVRTPISPISHPEDKEPKHGGTTRPGPAPPSRGGLARPTARGSPGTRRFPVSAPVCRGGAAPLARAQCARPGSRLSGAALRVGRARRRRGERRGQNDDWKATHLDFSFLRTTRGALSRTPCPHRTPGPQERLFPDSICSLFLLVIVSLCDCVQQIHTLKYRLKTVTQCLPQYFLQMPYRG